MNGSMIRYILGQVLKIEGMLMALPCVTALVYGEKQGFVYGAVACVCLVVGFLMCWRKPSDSVFYL